MNFKALKDRIRNMAAANNVDPQSLMQNFFLERILARVALSDYRKNIILKGGLLIASLIGTLYFNVFGREVSILLAYIAHVV